MPDDPSRPRGRSWARPLVVLVFALVTAALFAHHVAQYYFLGDDAYISFRYAWHFAHGHGLVFNPGVGRAHQRERTTAGLQERTDSVGTEVAVDRQPVGGGLLRPGLAAESGVRVVLGRHADVTAFGVEHDLQATLPRRRRNSLQGFNTGHAVPLETGRLKLDAPDVRGHGVQHTDGERPDRLDTRLGVAISRAQRRGQPLQYRVDSHADR